MFYFTATNDETGNTARIVLPSVTRCAEIADALRNKGIRCGIVNRETIHTICSVAEINIAMEFLDLVL